MDDNLTYPGLELNQDLTFQRRSWRVQRVAWGVMAAIVVATLLGLFGSGLLSSTTVSTPNQTMQVRYERFGRLDSPLITNVRLASGAGDADGRVRLWVSRGYLSRVAGDGLSPVPETTLTAADRVVFIFRLTDPAQPLDVTFYLNTEKVGSLTGQFGLVNRKAVLTIRQFIYP